jgi:Zn-dependent protease
MLLNLLFSGNIQDALITFAMWLPIILLAFSIHESAHALTASWLGDRTARNLGRVTLDPTKHLDLYGFISMLLFGIGWAKPVPIYSRNMKNPKWGMALTAIAGPVSNLLLGGAGAIVFSVVFFLVNGIIPAYAPHIAKEYYFAVTSGIFTDFLMYFSLINFIYAAFNLIPLPPFDGSRFFFTFLPEKWYFGIMKFERYIMAGVFLILLVWSRFFDFPSPFAWIAEKLFLLIANGGLDIIYLIYGFIINLIA